jgi:hypothetical protein
MKPLVRVRSVKALQAFRVLIEFTDGSAREIDLEPYLRGPMFELQRNDPKIFRSLRVDPAMGTIVWPDGADIDPDVLFKGLTPAWMESQAVVAGRTTQH